MKNSLFIGSFLIIFLILTYKLTGIFKSSNYYHAFTILTFGWSYSLHAPNRQLTSLGVEYTKIELREVGITTGITFLFFFESLVFERDCNYTFKYIISTRKLENQNSLQLRVFANSDYSLGALKLFLK